MASTTAQPSTQHAAQNYFAVAAGLTGRPAAYVISLCGVISTLIWPTAVVPVSLPLGGLRPHLARYFA